MSSPRNRREHQIRNEQIEVPMQTHTKCFDNSSGIVSSEESAHMSNSNSKSLKYDCGFIILGQSHSSRNVRESNDISIFDATVG